MHNKFLAYRPEIDGLRAIAVLPVILFHVGLSQFSGGFVGVDVFFVISGYLITSILLKERQENKLSILKFYERRARRILPVLFTMILCVIPFAWITLPPEEMQRFAQSVASTATFSSNFLFWYESGYFDSAAELKPLLHTWSLAVEEQYYIFFPLVIMIFWRFGFTALCAAITAIGIASFIYSDVTVSAEPMTAFYLLPSRAWELMVGAIVALILFKRPNLRGSHVGGIAGLALIAYSVYAFDQATPFPGSNALYPTIGAALIILFARPGTGIGVLLSFKPLVWIGLLSYSAYLWHQPIIALAKVKMMGELTVLAQVSIIALTIALSVASYWIVEKPFRKSGASRARVLSYAAAASVLVTATGIYGHLQKGFPDRMNMVYSKEARTYEESILAKYTTDSLKVPEFASPPDAKTIFIVGDSYLRNWSSALNSIIDHSKYRVISASYLGCDVKFENGIIKSDPLGAPYKANCADFNKIINDKELMQSVEKIILTSHRPFEYSSNRFRFDILSYVHSVGKSPKTYVIGSYYQMDGKKHDSCLMAMFVSWRDASICRDIASYPAEKQDITKLPLFKSYTVPFEYIDLIGMTCKNEKSACPYESDGVPFITDWNHLTAAFIRSIMLKASSSHRNEFERIGLGDVFIKSRDVATNL